jgi:hypothetical protein
VDNIWEEYTPRPCFTTFCFNALCQYVRLLSVRPVIFGLTRFDWLRSVTVTRTCSVISCGNVVFYVYLFFILNFSGKQQGRKRSPWCTVCFFWGGEVLAVDFSDMLVPIYQTTRCHKPNNHTMNLHHCKALNLNYVRGKASR